MDNQRKQGSIYEQKAAAYLVQRGFRILQMNYRCRSGEVDLIARQDAYLVFVEVKYRRNSLSGYPCEAVDGRKQRQISKAAQYYMFQQGISQEMPVRFDVVSILGEEIQFFENAFEFQV